MFLFRAFDMYVVKVLGGHPKDKCRYHKYHTTFCVQQQAPDNTCGFHVFLNMVAFGVQPNCSISVSAVILLYCQSLRHSYFIHRLCGRNNEHFVYYLIVKYN
jgi:hypothetical protein